MLSKPCILLYGHDDHLLETRKWVLEPLGFSVRTVGSLPALNETILAHKIDILILCHSLSSEECERALEVAHTHAPEIKAVVLTGNDTTCARGAGPEDSVLDTWDGPKALVETVRQLTDNQKSA